MGQDRRDHLGEVRDCAAGPEAAMVLLRSPAAQFPAGLLCTLYEEIARKSIFAGHGPVAGVHRHA
jgi:hypothetical protein